MAPLCYRRHRFPPEIIQHAIWCGRFLLFRQTRGDRKRAKVREVKEELRRRMHDPIPSQGQWLRQVATGFFAYYAVPTNVDALAAFRYHIMTLWMRTLTRRSQKDRTG